MARQVNTHAGPFFNGCGDAVVMAWIAEATKGTGDEIELYAHASKRQLLDVLGQRSPMLIQGALP